MPRKKVAEEPLEPVVIPKITQDLRMAMLDDIVTKAIERTQKFREELQDDGTTATERSKRIGELLTKVDLGCRDKHIREIFSLVLGERVPSERVYIPYVDGAIVVIAHTGREGDDPEGVFTSYKASTTIKAGAAYLTCNEGAYDATGTREPGLPTKMESVDYIRPASDDEIRTYIGTIAANSMPRIIDLAERIYYRKSEA